MIVDCSTCTIRGDACAGCVVSLLFGSEPGGEVPWHSRGAADLLGRPARGAPPHRLDDVDRAIGVLAAAGMLDAQDLPVPVTVMSPLSGLRSIGA